MPKRCRASGSKTSSQTRSSNPVRLLPGDKQASRQRQRTCRHSFRLLTKLLTGRANLCPTISRNISRIQGNDETGSSLVSRGRDRGLYQSFSKLLLSFQGRFQRHATSHDAEHSTKTGPELWGRAYSRRLSQGLSKAVASHA